MRSSLSREKSFHKVPGKHSLEDGGGEPPYCLRSFKRHKVTASPQFHTKIGAVASELHGTCNAGVTIVESSFETLKGEPRNLPLKTSSIDLISGSMKPSVLQCKASAMNVEMEILRVPEKVELVNTARFSDTSSMACVLPRKYPPPKIRKGVTVFREFPQNCGRGKLDMFPTFKVNNSEKKQMMFEAEKQQIRGGSCNVGSEFAKKLEEKMLEDIDDKVAAESEIATQADKAELFDKVCYSDCKLNQEASIDTIMIASFPPSNSLQANSSSKLTSNTYGVRMERDENDPDKDSINNSLAMHLVNNEYVDMAYSGGGTSIGQQKVKTSYFAAATGATVGYGDKPYELMGHEGSYYLLLKHNDAKSNDGGSATRMGVTTSNYEAATGATDECSKKVYEVMGRKGYYYLLLIPDNIIFDDVTTAAQESQKGVKTSDPAEATVATDGCNETMYELMGQKGSYYLLLKQDDTNNHVPYVEADVHNVEAGIHNAEPALDRKENNSTHSGKPSINLTVNSNQEALCRSKVREVLNLFRKTLKERLLEEQVTRKSRSKTRTISSHIYEDVAMLLKQQNEWICMNERVLGAIPGVEVGDQFQYRAELVIVGVHIQFVADIDYMEKDSKKIATSIVSTRFYSDDEELTDVIYICEGGNRTLAQGRLALKNSMDERSPVRVIRGHQCLEGKSTSYTYDGLYIVSKFWQERWQNGNLVYMFQLNKMQGQPKLRVNKQGKHGKSKACFYRTLIDDISYGKEKMSIPVVNDIDNDKSPTFNYITKMVYPPLRKSANVRGCRCIGGCSDDVQCSCVVKNGGMIPFNEDGAIVKAKSIVYECGPSCKCPPSCTNRVSQHGLKIQLEVFKTEMRGWGIRSRNFISSGSFICEYVGELLDDKQAEERIGFDEYLFDIGDEDGFAIDAANFGNIGRFVNHSCSPNLYAQDVLFDHDDKMMPHVMLFATKNIHPLQELTYDYNYKVGHVSDSNGNVKEKACHCGARKCTGRMY
ncbi:hypothetical protein ACET3Z_009626 [Daucus carota]